MKREIALACPNPPGRVAQDAFVMHEIVARCSKVVCMSQPLLVLSSAQHWTFWAFSPSVEKTCWKPMRCASNFCRVPIEKNFWLGWFQNICVKCFNTSQLLSVLTTLQPFKPSKRIRITCNSNIATL